MIACREIRLRLVLRNLSYVVYKRSDGKWGVPIFSMFIDVPDQAEQKLGEYVLDTLADGKELAQALADQRGWTW